MLLPHAPGSVAIDGVKPPVDPSGVVNAFPKTPRLMQGVPGQVLGGHPIDPEAPSAGHQAVAQSGQGLLP